MAGENFFIAVAVTMTSTLGFFTYLHWMASKTGNWLFERVWMMGAFATVYLSIGFLRRGFQNYLVDTALADLTFSLMHILQEVMVLLFGWLLLSIAYHGIRQIIDAVEGRRYDPVKEQTKEMQKYR